MPEPPERIFERATPAQLTERLTMIQERVRLGIMPAAALDEVLKLFQFTDDVGHLWAPGAASGRWYRWDRTQWTPGDPPPALNVPDLLRTLIPGPAASRSVAPGSPAASMGSVSPVATPAPSSAPAARPAASPAHAANTAPAGGTKVFCSRCGTRTPAGAKFCSGCGAPIALAVPTPAAAAPPVVPSSQPKFCPQCGAPAAGKKFCANCGTPLSAAPAGAVCPQCGTAAVPGQAFCRRCGTRLAAGASAVAPAASVAAASPPPAAPAPRPAAKARSGAMKGLLKVVVPVAALIVSYVINSYITKNYGAMLAAQFGDLSRQAVPMVVFSIVGAVAYKIVAR